MKAVLPTQYIMFFFSSLKCQFAFAKMCFVSNGNISKIKTYSLTASHLKCFITKSLNDGNYGRVENTDKMVFHT